MDEIRVTESLDEMTIIIKALLNGTTLKADATKQKREKRIHF